VVEAGDGLRLAHHPLHRLTAQVDHLHSHVALEALVPCPIDRAESAASQPLADLETAHDHCAHHRFFAFGTGRLNPCRRLRIPHRKANSARFPAHRLPGAAYSPRGEPDPATLRLTPGVLRRGSSSPDRNIQHRGPAPTRRSTVAGPPRQQIMLRRAIALVRACWCLCCLSSASGRPPPAMTEPRDYGERRRHRPAE
jgi:hypothetical protein